MNLSKAIEWMKLGETIGGRWNTILFRIIKNNIFYITVEDWHDLKPWRLVTKDNYLDHLLDPSVEWRIQ
jgi:hypothetical protein